MASKQLVLPGTNLKRFEHTDSRAERVRVR
jgi:hypothetical protein